MLELVWEGVEWKELVSSFGEFVWEGVSELGFMSFRGLLELVDAVR